MRIKPGENPRHQMMNERRRSEKRLKEKPLNFEKKIDLVKQGIQRTLVIKEIIEDNKLIKRFDKIYGNN